MTNETAPLEKADARQDVAGSMRTGPSQDELLRQLQASEARAKNLAADYIRLSKALTETARVLADHQVIISQTTYGLGQAARRAWAVRFNLMMLLGDLFYAARRARLNPHRTLSLFQEIRLIRASGWLDSQFYPPQRAASAAPSFEDARNYVIAGRDLDPNRLFSGSAYLALNKDVRIEATTPLAHFLRFGADEWRPVTVPARVRPSEADDRTAYAWPLAVAGSAAQPSASRPDDSVLTEGAAGKAFLARHGLLGQAPDFAGAVRELEAMAGRDSLTGPDDPPPQASIVIPVYGQLAYTLNCLHSLFAHPTRVSFEILVGDDASVDGSERFLGQIPGIRYVRHPVNAGFIDNCNTTAALARGDHIVLLNNDTRVVAGWLDEMIGSFALFPKAGLVGSKLFYDDGTLQEAGGIFWRDGSAWNYGRDDDPNRPGYCYARPVDYASGAAIAVPRTLWNDLGGFDELYRPAYAEDADMAFRIRAMGHETWMQPLSRVIHYEGRTSGTDLTQGAKAYQVANLRKFAERWADVLAGFRPNGEAPALERERGFEKRVLVIDAVTPNPNEDAGSVLTVTYLRLYQELGYKVYFIPSHNFLYQPVTTDALRRIGIECIYRPYYTSVEQFLRRHGHTLDLVQIFRVGVADESLDLIRRHAWQAPVIFHNVDMHFLRMERQAALEGSPALQEAAKAMKIRELEVTEAADCAVVLSTAEDDILKVEVPDADVVVFPFMTPVMGTSAGFAERRDIMFLGGYRHPPNVDAALFLAKEVWPLVRSQLPGARLLLVGAHAPEEVKDLASDDILVTGQVDDLQPMFDRTRVFAASIRYGAGIKGKVATAMSYGVPVVATTVAAEGMYLVDGRDVRIADDANQIAKAIVDLYRNPAEWARLSANGLAFVDENNSTAMGRRILTEIIDRAALRHARRAVSKFDIENA